MARLLFLKMKKLMHSVMHLLLFFYFELYLNTSSKEIYSFICYYKEEKEVCSKYFLFKEFCRFSQTACQENVSVITKVSYCFALGPENVSVITKVSYCFALGKAGAPLLDQSRNRNSTICGYVNIKNNIEEF